MEIEQRHIPVNGRRVTYLVAGSGQPLLLLHGVGENSAGWRHVLRGLADRYTVYAPDLPGYGDSEPLAAGGPTPERYAAVMADFLNTVAGPGPGSDAGPDAGRGSDAGASPDAGPGPAAVPVTVIGHSLGGLIALELALRHPGRVGRLVLEGSAGLGHHISPALRSLTLPGYGDVAQRIGHTRLGAAQRAWARVPLMFARPRLAPPDWMAEQRRLATLPRHLPTSLAALRAQVGLLGQRRVLLDELPRLEVPTLILWGAEDAVVPVVQARAAVARLRDGRLAVVPGCGHLPHLERPEQFLEAIRTFDTA